MMRRLGLVFLLGIHISLQLCGQDTLLVPVSSLDETRSDRGLFVSLQAGAIFGDLAAVNVPLVDNLYGPLSETILSMGLRADRYHHRMIWGGQLYNFTTSQSRLNGQTALLQFHYGIIHVGRQLWRGADRRHVSLTGGVGYGAGFMRVRLALGTQSERFQTAGPLMELALHGHHHFILQGRVAYLAMVSMTVGYLHSVDNAWIMRGLDLEGVGLPLSPQGPYVRLGIGMGQWSKFRRKTKIVPARL